MDVYSTGFRAFDTLLPFRKISYQLIAAFEKQYLYIVQSVKKVEVQEALPPAGVIGAEPLTLVPQHFPRKPA